MLWYQKKIKSRTKLRIFNSVIMPTLLYGVECTVLLEPHFHRLQGFVMRCLKNILRVSLWDKQCNTTMCELAKQRVSSILVQHRRRLLGHLVRMRDSRLPKKMLVCAPADGSRAAAGQKCRWNDLVVKDLRKCGVEEDWHDVALDRRAWRCVVREGAEELNKHNEHEEVKWKDERRQRRKNRLVQANAALSCPHPGCIFVALSKAGLVNHCRQKYQQALHAQCIYCGKVMLQQGLHNHQRFCGRRPS